MRTIVFTCLMLLTNWLYASDEWLLGKWELVYDPHERETDYIEFLANGDAISRGKLGKIQGIYVYDDTSVKAVFTYKDQDFIMTFHTNPERTELRIVTSHTQRESIYKKSSHKPDGNN